MSGLPIAQEEIAFIAACKNLEWLEIDKTPIGDKEIDTLTTLSKLETLKVFETNITDESLVFLGELPNLKSLYIWQTSVSKEAVDRLKSQKPALLINYGIDEEIQSFFIAKDSVPEI